MAGAFRLALSRATVTVENGAELARGATVTVRDGVARIRQGSVTTAEAPAVDVERRSGRNYRILLADGSAWLVAKPCNCAGGR